MDGIRKCAHIPLLNCIDGPNQQLTGLIVIKPWIDICGTIEMDLRCTAKVI